MSIVLSENIKDALQNAKDKKYSEFEDAVRKELNTKLANNPAIKKYSDGIDKMQALKDAFAAINKSQEPEDPKDPVDPKDPKDPVE